MSILGALYSAVSGLSASSNALGMISDNISNSNTVGYKETSTNFQTLVTQASGATTLYSPGGVQSSPVYNIDNQGVMQSTNSPTDLAISGHGFFVVNTNPGGAASGATFSFTRAGNFTVDSTGNLVNGAGLYLQGQKLTPAQSLAIANGNLQQLTATSLNSLQTINVDGIGGSASATANVTLSANLPASDTASTGARTMTVPIFDSQGIEHDMTLSFTRVAPTSSTQDFTYGGTAATGDQITVSFDGNTYTTQPLTQASPSITDVMNAINGQFNASTVNLTGTPQVGDTFTATINGTAYNSAALAGAGPFTATDVSNALNSTLTAINVPVTVGVSVAGDTLTATINGTGYTTAALPASATINQMQAAIQAVLPAGVTATVNGTNIEFKDGSGILYSASISKTGTGTETFGAGVQTTTFTTKNVGGNLVFVDSTGNAPAVSVTSTDSNLTLATQASSNTYTMTNPSGSTLEITDTSGAAVTSPAITKASGTGTETFTNGTTSTGVSPNRWSVAATFPNSGATTASILPGDNIVQFNSDGTLNLPASTFGAANALSINWDPSVSGGTSPQSITFDIGTNGSTNGLSQLGTTFSVGTINQDGVKFGNFTGVTVDANGIVTANFNNGLHQAIYILPIATFANPDGLTPVTGNTYFASASSGAVLLNQAGTGAAGTVSPSSLENSTVDIATEFSKLIIMQNAYQANSKVITVSDQMLQSLLNIQTG
jgi:flagellar hook protein FlgE